MNDRREQVLRLEQVVRRPLESAAASRLAVELPLPDGRGAASAGLEALGRTLTGIAPWLECTGLTGPEEALRVEFAELARRAIAVAVDPASPGFLNFNRGMQPLVDSAFLAHGILRAPRELWERLAPDVRRNLVAALASSREITPACNNWLFFSAMVECFMKFAGEPFDRMRVEYAINTFKGYYCGDGIYGDGPEFHWDYYNSFVIQPMALEVFRSFPEAEVSTQRRCGVREQMTAAARRYAVILERMIGTDGSYPAIGRSITYRCGAFHLLAAMALDRNLPEELSPAAVRGALTAVIRRTLDAPGTFDRDGWLRIGLSGFQPGLGEVYINTGSLYLCTTAFLPLGLPPEDPFWSLPDEPWSSVKLWNGVDLPADHAI